MSYVSLTLKHVSLTLSYRTCKISKTPGNVQKMSCVLDVIHKMYRTCEISDSGGNVIALVFKMYKNCEISIS